MKSKIFLKELIFQEMEESIEQMGESTEQIFLHGALEPFRF